MHNRMHDFAYFLGFTEQNWNAQAFNFGITDAAGERPAHRRVQPAHCTDARQREHDHVPDGAASITNMYFWQPIAASFYRLRGRRLRHGGHRPRYGHMIENRMIGKGNAAPGFHAGAMGEGFGDLNAAST